MKNVYTSCEIVKEFGSRTSSAGFHQGVSASKSALCSSCGRDLSRPNLIPLSISSSCAKPQSLSCLHEVGLEVHFMGYPLS